MFKKGKAAPNKTERCLDEDGISLLAQEPFGDSAMPPLRDRGLTITVSMPLCAGSRAKKHIFP